jgi:hypothetical protein
LPEPEPMRLNAKLSASYIQQRIVPPPERSPRSL